MSSLLDILLSLALITFVIYALNIIEEGETRSKNNLTNFFTGLMLFFIGIKTSFYILFLHNRSCIYINLFEIILNFFNLSSTLVLLYYLLELGLLILVYSKIQGFLDMQSRELDLILNN